MSTLTDISTRAAEEIVSTDAPQYEHLRARAAAIIARIFGPRFAGDDERFKYLCEREQVWANTLAENELLGAQLASAREALEKVREQIKPMADQIICPKDNTLSRLVAIIDATLSAPADAPPQAVRDDPYAAIRAEELQKFLKWIDYEMVGNQEWIKTCRDEEGPGHWKMTLTAISCYNTLRTLRENVEIRRFDNPKGPGIDPVLAAYPDMSKVNYWIHNDEPVFPDAPPPTETIQPVREP